MIVTITFLLIFLIWSYVLFGAFLIYASVKRTWKNLKPMTKFLVGPFLGLYPVDVGFNIIFGSIIFLELPMEWTFSERCSRHVDDTNWRGYIANFFCDNLNPFDPGHCKKRKDG